MPRGARLDSPGTLHHVIVRGIERRRIVDDDQDREDFVSRLAQLTKETGTAIYAWALMPNHVHILLKSGPAGLPTLMRRLLSGYAVSYNRRHRRHGHLFQNRYKSIVCEEELYFQELVRYIHLNPLRGSVVDSLAKLDRFKWCGHTYVLGRRQNDWQDCDYVLGWFGDCKKESCKAYHQFVEQGVNQGQRPELVGGGLIRSMGGWSIVQSMRKKGKMWKSDERILGSGKFVEQLVEEAERRIEYQLRSDKIRKQSEELINKACGEARINAEALRAGSRVQAVASVRNVLALKLVNDLGMTLAETARQLGVATSAISQILRRHKK